MKILMYSHDSYGLGHLRRTLALAEAFIEHARATSVLILTGSVMSGTFRMSQGIDLVKLPSAVKIANGVYRPSRMQVDFECLRRMRSSLIMSVAKSFDPDAFIMDKSPLGMKREVYPLLEYLRGSRSSTLTVLGLRGVMDDPARVRRHWQDHRIDKDIERFYDLILVYGPRKVYDPLPDYGLSIEVMSRSHYVGYVGRDPVLQAASGLSFRPGYVLVTAGGGGDGYYLIKTYLDSLRVSEPSFESIVVTGPLMDDGAKREVEQISQDLCRDLCVQVLEFRPDMERLIGAAGAVVAMGGYNTTTELLAARKPAVIVPRVQPRAEQLIRAKQLASLGLVDMIHPENLTPALLRSKVEELLERGPTSLPRARVDLSGAARVVELVSASMADKHAVAAGS